MTYERKQTLKLKQETAHEMELVLDTFHNMLEPLEEYIGKTDYYSDWNSRRQIYRKTIADSNDTAEGFEDLFLTQLLIVKASVNRKPEFFRKEIKKEYYRWINATGINVSNCPDKLKHFLFEINEILEGKGENFIEQTKKLVKDTKLTPQDALGFFSVLQEPLNKNAERGKLIKGKNWNEVGNENKLSGDAEEGEEMFNQISQTISDQNDFDFYQGDYYTDQSNYNRRIMVENIKQNINEWEIKEVVTFSSYLTNKKEKRIILIHKSAKEEYARRYTGWELKFQPGKMYRKKDLRGEEWEEIENALNNSNSIDGSSSAQAADNPQPLTNSEIIQLVKNNSQNWRLDEVITKYNYSGMAIEKEIALIHNSVEIGFDGAVYNWQQQQVYLIQRFNSEERAEIEQALGISNNSSAAQDIWSLVEDIKRNIHEFEFQAILTFNGCHYDATNKTWVRNGKEEKRETMLVHKSVQISNNDYDKFGCLLIQQAKMFQEYRFNQQEWAEIKKALENSKIIERVNQNDWMIATVNPNRGGSYEALINKSAIEGQNLKDGGEFYNKTQFTDEEWTKIKSSQSQNQQHSKSQVFSVSSENKPSQNNSGNTGLVISLVMIGALLGGSVILAKRQLNKKVKK